MTDPAPTERAGYAEWRQRVERELGGDDFESSLVTRLAEGIPVQPLYVDRPGSSREPRLPTAGGLGWHLCPRYETALPEAVNEHIREDAAGGATALWLRFDRAARSGVDADDLAAGGLAGREGVAAHHLGALDAALAGVELDALPLLIDGGSNAIPLAALLFALIEKRGLECHTVEAHLNCDPLAALAQDGQVPASLGDLESEMGLLARFCHTRLPSGTAITVSDLPYNLAGATAADELGMAAATLVWTLRRLAAGGCGPEIAAPHILLRSAVDRDIFLSIAKLRALRVLWSKVVHAAGVQTPPTARIHAVTSDRPLAARDPWVNMLRATTQTFGAIVGGADFVTTAAWDRPLGDATSSARRLARNTQSILGAESALGRVTDPAGGSYYVEQLTDELARRGWEVMQEIETAGGAGEALTSGWLARRLADRWEARRAAASAGELAMTGVNTSVNASETAPRRETPNPDTLADEAALRLREHRRQRAGTPDLELACALDQLAVWVEMAAQGATLGEISIGLRRACCQTMAPLPRHRDSEELES